MAKLATPEEELLSYAEFCEAILRLAMLKWESEGHSLEDSVKKVQDALEMIVQNCTNTAAAARRQAARAEMAKELGVAKPRAGGAETPPTTRRRPSRASRASVGARGGRRGSREFSR